MQFHRFILPEAPQIEVKGDPNLTHWVQKQRPKQVRPDFSDVSALRVWQESLRSTLLEEVFEFPNIMSPVVVDEDDISSVVLYQNVRRTFLTYTSFDGSAIPAYLFMPHAPVPGSKPAIIVLHGHVPEGESGISQTAGLLNSYQNEVALALARAGFVTLTLEFRGFGYLGKTVNTEHRLVAYNAILAGSFYKAILTKDIKYALDFLRSLEGVDSQRIGLTGVSFGGEMATTYAALDKSIKVVVFQGYGGLMGPESGVVGTQWDQPHYCHMIPGHNTYLFQEDLFMLIAPRPLLGVRGDREYDGDNKFSKTIGKAYESLNASSSFRFEVVRGGHEYFVKQALQFFQQHL